MLTASSDRYFGTSRILSTIVLERRFRMHVQHRERLLFDSRFHPSTRQTSGATLYVVLHGSMQCAGESPARGPRAYVLAEGEFERVGPGSATFRSWGAPSVTVELRLAERDLRIPIGIAAGPVDLGESMWARWRALVDACAAGTSVEPRVRDVIRALGDDGIIDATIATTFPEAESEMFVTLWKALRPLYANHATSASVRDIKRATGLSIRQLGRDLKSFTREFGLGDGYRDALRVLRLRAAIALLSAPAATATAVAKQVGYKSLDAMGRAFREAGLPAPSEVLESNRYRD